MNQCPHTWHPDVKATITLDEITQARKTLFKLLQQGRAARLSLNSNGWNIFKSWDFFCKVVCHLCLLSGLI